MVWTKENRQHVPFDMPTAIPLALDIDLPRHGGENRSQTYSLDR